MPMHRFRTLLSAAVLVAIPWVAGPAGADTPKEQARAFARTAEALGSEGKLDAAADLFERAYGLDPEPVLLYNAARAHQKRGDPARARPLFERFLAEEKDPEGLARGRARLEEVLDALPGRIVVKTTPADATVTVDGQPAKAGEFKLKRGPHEVAAERAGHRRTVRTVDVAFGQETRVDLTLAPLPGSIRIDCNTPGASVFVDGRLAGKAPVPVVEADAGRHVVEVHAAGYDRYVQTVEVRSDAVTTLPVVLQAVAVARPVPVPEPVPEPVPAARAPVSADLSTSVPPPRPSYSPWKWVLLGAGGAALAGGAVCFGLASADRNKVTSATKSPSGGVIGITQSQAAALESSANTKANAGLGLVIAGGAVAVTGVILAIVDAARPAAQSGLPVGFAASPMRGGAAAGVVGRF